MRRCLILAFNALEEAAQSRHARRGGIRSPLVLDGGDAVSLALREIGQLALKRAGLTSRQGRSLRAMPRLLLAGPGQF